LKDNREDNLSEKTKTPYVPEDEPVKVQKPPLDWGVALSWIATGLIVTGATLVLLKTHFFKNGNNVPKNSDLNNSQQIPLPSFMSGLPVDEVFRTANINTNPPDGVRHNAVKYTVESGDSIFLIAKKFNVSAESILWANYSLLNDDPTIILEGWTLTIPPTNGIYYKWKQGDTIEKVAQKFYADPERIITWPGNHLDVSNPVTDNLSDFKIMIPGGYRELVPWIEVLPFAPRTGVLRVVAGPGGCEAPAYGPIGTGAMIWPVWNNELSGFGYSSYHRGVDLAAGVGTPVVASDNGTVIYSGWNDSGYGYLVEIDHNNGYSTVYAHLSEGSLAVRCGDSVNQGQYLALSGSTGKSTGGHLHFEVRYNGGFVNPYSAIP
jgi:murein DD-endopeptidase MepM/ murein hydrolase activator NlpD